MSWNMKIARNFVDMKQTTETATWKDKNQIGAFGAKSIIPFLEKFTFTTIDWVFSSVFHVANFVATVLILNVDAQKLALHAR